LAAAHNIEFVSLQSGVDAGLTQDIANTAIATSDPVKSVRLIMDGLMFPALDEMYSRCLEMARWSDVVVSHFFQIAGRMAAEATGRPFVTGTLVATQLPTSSRPPGSLPNLGRRFNGLLWKMALWYMNAGWLGPVNEARARFGLGALDDLALRGFYSPHLNLVAVSPTVYHRPDDWPRQHRVTGYWLLDTPEGWNPPTEVVDFIANGPIPVAVGFGSMTSQHSGVLTGRVLEAVKMARTRAIIEPGMARLGEVGSSAEVLIAKDIPHSWLLPRVSALIHHGGAGTTAASIRAGIPSVVVPHVFDQHFWAKRAERLGVAPSPVPLRNLTAQRLASAIVRAARDPGLKERAGRLGVALDREHGADRAVRLVEDYVRTGRADGAVREEELRSIP
jgi:sterol 3beta-glucosyltransferase